jgi:hypothetical protein
LYGRLCWPCWAECFSSLGLGAPATRVLLPTRAFKVERRKPRLPPVERRLFKAERLPKCRLQPEAWCPREEAPAPAGPRPLQPAVCLPAGAQAVQRRLAVQPVATEPAEALSLAVKRPVAGQPVALLFLRDRVVVVEGQASRAGRQGAGPEAHRLAVAPLSRVALWEVAARLVAPQPAVRHRLAPQLAARHRLAPQPAARHRLALQLAARHRAASQPAARHRAAPQPAARHQAVPRHL